MSSKTKVLQEYEFPEASWRRKKVDIDGFRLFESLKDAVLQRGGEKMPQGLESKYDLRKSLAWDSAFFTSPGVLDPEELFETLNIHDGKNGVKEASALPSELLAESRIAECIARGSLAWDTAFFTSAGVLDPEELSMVNKGYKKSEMRTLPGIQEEIWKSAESNCKMDSDYSLASLEIDLFEDMRASMKKSSKSNNVATSSCKIQSRKGIPNPHSSKTLDTSTTNSIRIKPLSEPRRPNVQTHGVVKTEKEGINLPEAQHAKRTGESDSSYAVKAPKGLSQSSPLSSAATKRASLGGNHLKASNKVRKAVSGQNMAKKPCIGDSGSFIPSSTLSPEPASLRLRVPSRDLSGSASGQNTPTDKSPHSLRRKNDSGAGYSNSRTPLRSSNRHKTKQIDSSQPTDVLLSTPQTSSKSLCNAIDCWSSDSPASVNHASNKLTKSLNCAFSGGVPMNNDASRGSDTENCPGDRAFVRNGSKETKLPSQNGGRFSRNQCSLPETKPSGLRLPSPKIGFFDVENSRALTPNGGLKFRSGVQNTSKIRSSANQLNGTSYRAKFGMIQPPRTSKRTAGGVKEKKSASLKTGNQSLRCTKLNCSAQLEGEKAFQGFTFSGTIRNWRASNIKVETDISCQSSAADGSNTQSSSGDDTSTLIRDDKENVLSLENQVDVLTEQIEAIDFSKDLVIEF